MQIPGKGEKLKDFVDRCKRAGLSEALSYSLWRKGHKRADRIAASFGNELAKLCVHSTAWKLSGAEEGSYRKEIIRVGEFTKGEQVFAVTADLITHWANVCNSMLEDGIKIPITGCDHIVDESKSYGWVTAFEADGDSLFAVMNIVGENVEQLVKTNDVSIYSPAEYAAGNGIIYPRPITSIALTPMPVVNGLADFEEMAASMTLSDEAVESPDVIHDNTTIEVIAEEKGKEVDLNKLAEAIGYSAEDGTELDEAKVLEALSELVDKAAAADEVVKAAEEQKAICDKAIEASNSRMKEAAETIAASHNTTKPDDRLIKAISDSTSLRIDTLISAGNISRAVGEQLKKRLDTGTLAMSVVSNSDVVLQDMLLILSQNRPLILGEQTPAQVLTPSVPVEGQRQVSLNDVARDFYNRK